MAENLVTMAVLPETKELVREIATKYNEKMIAVADRAIRDYAKKKERQVAAGN